MSTVEKTISYFTAGLVVVASLLLLSFGPGIGLGADKPCAAVETMAPEQLGALLERLATDPQRPANLDAATLTRCGAGDIPAEALPCLEERLREHLAARPS